MFKPLSPPKNTVSVQINGKQTQVAPNISAAAALLQHHGPVWRNNIVSGEKRGPFCMIGNCFDCLVTIDGKPNQQACRTRIVAGMHIQTAEQIT